MGSEGIIVMCEWETRFQQFPLVLLICISTPSTFPVNDCHWMRATRLNSVTSKQKINQLIWRETYVCSLDLAYIFLKCEHQIALTSVWLSCLGVLVSQYFISHLTLCLRVDSFLEDSQIRILSGVSAWEYFISSSASVCWAKFTVGMFFNNSLSQEMREKRILK